MEEGSLAAAPLCSRSSSCWEKLTPQRTGPQTPPPGILKGDPGRNSPTELHHHLQT